MSLEGKNNAWINPAGRFISVGFMCHDEWARDYFVKKYGGIGESMDRIEEICNSSTSAYPHVALHKLGWVRLITWTENKTVVCGNCDSRDGRLDTTDPKLNPKQKETLQDWCMDNNFKYENLFK